MVRFRGPPTGALKGLAAERSQSGLPQLTFERTCRGSLPVRPHFHDCAPVRERYLQDLPGIRHLVKLHYMDASRCWERVWLERLGLQSSPVLACPSLSRRSRSCALNAAWNGYAD